MQTGPPSRPEGSNLIRAPATRLIEDPISGLRGGLDVVIPRGGTALIEAVSDAARVPVIQHWQGVCHLFVHADADLDQAEQVVVNAKTQRPGVCNAMEALLVDAAIADRAIPRLARAMADRGCEIRACERSIGLAGEGAVPAQGDDRGREFLDLICLVQVVEGLEGALDHIRRHGSRHTEGILTSDLATADAFVRGVDASCVVVNASTRFNDGGCLGLGAELGISTSKLHAYGPMGLVHLTTERRQDAGQGEQRGGLAGTVRAEQAHHFTGIHVQAEATHDGNTAVPGCEIADTDESVFGAHDWPPP